MLFVSNLFVSSIWQPSVSVNLVCRSNSCVCFWRRIRVYASTSRSLISSRAACSWSPGLTRPSDERLSHMLLPKYYSTSCTWCRLRLIAENKKKQHQFHNCEGWLPAPFNVIHAASITFLQLHCFLLYTCCFTMSYLRPLSMCFRRTRLLRPEQEIVFNVLTAVSSCASIANL